MKKYVIPLCVYMVVSIGIAGAMKGEDDVLDAQEKIKKEFNELIGNAKEYFRVFQIDLIKQHVIAGRMIEHIRALETHDGDSRFFQTQYHKSFNDIIELNQNAVDYFNNFKNRLTVLMERYTALKERGEKEIEAFDDQLDEAGDMETELRTLFASLNLGPEDDEEEDD